MKSSALPRRLRAVQVKLDVPNQVVYSVHDYGPSMYRGMPWFQLGSTASTSDACFGVWDKTWGFILHEEIAPVYLGEFGTPNGLKQDRDTDPAAVPYELHIPADQRPHRLRLRQHPRPARNLTWHVPRSLAGYIPQAE